MHDDLSTILHTAASFDVGEDNEGTALRKVLEMTGADG
jgi:hypothetical protein